MCVTSHWEAVIEGGEGDWNILPWEEKEVKPEPPLPAKELLWQEGSRRQSAKPTTHPPVTCLAGVLSLPSMSDVLQVSQKVEKKYRRSVIEGYKKDTYKKKAVG